MQSFENHVNEKYIIHIESNDSHQLQLISQFLWDLSITDYVFLETSNKQEFTLYSIQPFSRKHCRRPELLKVCSIDNGTKIDCPAIPQKYTNLFQCPIHIIFLNLPPVSQLIHENQTFRIIGFEAVIIQEMAKKLNFSIITYVPPLQDILKSGTIVDYVVNVIEKKKVDMVGRGLVYRKERLQTLSVCYPHFYTYYIVYIRKESQHLSSLKVLLSPYEQWSWYAIIGLFSMCVFVLFLIRKSHWINIIFQMTSITLSSPLSSFHSRLSERIVFGTWMIFNVIFSTTYLGKFFELMLLDLRQPMPNTLTDLIEQNYTMVVHPIYYNNMKNIPEMKMMNKIVTSNYGLILLDFIAKSESKVASIVMETSLLVNISLYEKDTFHFLNQQILPYYFSLYQTKNSFLTDQFDKILLNLRKSGILEQFAQWTFQRPFVNQPFVHYGCLEGFRAIFNILIFLYLITIVAFVCELLINKLFVKKT